MVHCCHTVQIKSDFLFKLLLECVVSYMCDLHKEFSHDGHLTRAQM